MSRYAFPSNEDQQPVTFLAGHALYGAHILVVVFVVSLLATTLLQAFGAGSVLNKLIFINSEVFRGEVWRLFTYGFVNPPRLWFLIDMFLMVRVGRELETFFGRRTFFTLYAGIYLITPLLFTALGFVWQPLVLGGVPGSLALFTAFVTLYPNITFFFGILAKWLAVAVIGIYGLMHLANNDWPQFIALLATTGFSFAFVRYAQGRFTLPELPKLKRPTPRAAASDTAPVSAKPARDSKSELMAEVDALLDRIAKDGIDSLSAKERARLDSARETLLKQNRSRR